MTATSMKSLLVLLLCAISPSALAEALSFDEFYAGVSQCRFDLSRYDDVPMDPYTEALLIALPNAGARRGFLITTFYFSPAREGKAEGYGLVFNAPLDVVAHAFPELAARETINGHLRRLLRLSDETNDRKAARQTLLLCNSGMPT
jgi:hypothetical protein